MTRASSLLVSAFPLLPALLGGVQVHALPSPSDASPPSHARLDGRADRRTADFNHLRKGKALGGKHKGQSSHQRRATTCNGHAELCDRSFGNVTFVGAHDSYAISSSQIAANQEQSITTQLNDGIRMLQAQGHKSTNSTPTGAGIDLCHTSCSLFQGGSLENYLTQVKSWVDSNPNEVISLLFVNSDDLPATTWAEAFASTGLDTKSYRPAQAATARDGWPTLGQLIDNGTTVITFMDNSADTTSVPYILPEFQNIWETPYDQVSTPFNCSVDRINTGSEAANLMYLTNHYLDTEINLLGQSFPVPDKSALDRTNGLDSVVSGADTCASQHGTYPNFILVDFYDYGNGSVFEAAAQLNNVQYTAKKIGNSTTSSSGSSSNSSAASPRITARAPLSALLGGAVTIAIGVLALV